MTTIKIIIDEKFNKETKQDKVRRIDKECLRLFFGLW